LPSVFGSLGTDWTAEVIELKAAEGIEAEWIEIIERIEESVEKGVGINI
jgi:hypothetical protein